MRCFPKKTKQTELNSSKTQVTQKQMAKKPPEGRVNSLANASKKESKGAMKAPEKIPEAKPKPSKTEPTGKKGGEPAGKKTEVKGSSELKRSLKRENESAELLAKNGYKVKQNPKTLPNGRNPDYKIEGKYFDCYAPKTDSLGKIRNKIAKKVKNEQADRIVVNLDDCEIEPNEIKDILKRKPKESLKEVIGIKNGELTQIFP